MAAKKKKDETTANRPRFGAYLTMTVGLIFFFGTISQVGKYAKHEGLLSATRRTPKNFEKRDEILKKRKRTIAVIGGTIPQDDIEVPTVPSDSIDRDNSNDRSRETARASNQKRHHIVRDRETLYRIAVKFYADGSKWKLISDANPGINASSLTPGTALIIPALPTDRMARGVGRSAPVRSVNY